MADLHALLARLKPSSSFDATTSTSQPPSSGSQNRGSTNAHLFSQNYRHPTVSSPIASPSPRGPEPLHSGILSPNLRPANDPPAMDQASIDRTANLLNLLKFNQPAPQTEANAETSRETHPAQEIHHVAPSEGPSPAFVRQPSSSSAVHRTSSLGSPTASASKPGVVSPQASSAENPQEILLRLLNRSQSHTSEGPARNALADPSAGVSSPVVSEAPKDMRETTPLRVFGVDNGPQSSPFEAPQPKGSIFTYINPFEQLAASSPRNRTPQREITLTPQNRENKEGPAKESVPAGETVSEALVGIAEAADKQVQEALAKADGGHANSLDREVSHDSRLSVQEVREAVHEVAVELKEELDRGNGETALEKSMPIEVAHEFRETVKEIANENVADSWESADAEDSPSKEDEDSVISVFNLPMRPFTSIDINNMPESPSGLRQDVIMEIARLKKDFDQIDRTLATASSNYIVYAMSKGGGFRVIRQDNGNDKQVFQGNENRIYNVAIGAKSASSQNTEIVLATGVNGSVYWTPVAPSIADGFEEEKLESKGFIFPPLASQDDGSNLLQLKTRAKKSSRHPDFFGMGRGKNIHIIWPSVAMSSRYINAKTRMVETEHYLSEHSLKIHTNKAGKDFSFSEDDSVIVSLDKAGRLKFWDIREMIDPSNSQKSKAQPIDIKNPLMTVWTVNPATEKSWPTSVIFMDKERPMAKGTALRYLLIGMKQNHTLLLWDIGLGKAVQEINFPHEKESDAICSIGYHPKSGIIAVGHPTRNSIYFIHLSAPRYNLPALSQATFIQRLVDKDPYLPSPESTAIMSGVREISFSGRGQLRSLDILNPTNPSSENNDQENSSIFELYVMHSKGVTCLNIKREDLGWGLGNKVLNPVDAQAKGIVSVTELREIGPPSEAATAPSATLKAVKPSAKIHPKESSLEDRDANSTLKSDKEERLGANGASKSKADDNLFPSLDSRKPDAPPRSPSRPASYAGAAQRGGEVFTTPVTSKDFAVPSQVIPKDLVDEMNGSKKEIKASGVHDDISRTLKVQLDQLYRRLDDDKRIQEAAGAAKQDAILRLVSSTLTDNVEKSLTRIVETSIKQSILPAVSNIAAATLNSKLSETIVPQINTAVPREVKNAIPSAINRAMQDPEVLRIISDLVSGSITKHVDVTFRRTLNDSIIPNFKNLAVEAAQKSATEIQRRVNDQLRHADMQRQSDGAKIDQLNTLSRELLDTVRTMAASQANLQRELAKLQNQIGQQNASSATPRVPAQQVLAREEPKDEELAAITSLMAAGKFEEATVQWLQSPRQAHLFDLLFVRCNPAYLRQTSHLITLSISAAVTASLTTHLPERLAWLELIFDTINPQDPDIADVAPQIIEVITGRLQAAYMRVAEARPGDPVLPRIGSVVRKVREVALVAQGT